MTIYAKTLGQGRNGTESINGVISDLAGQINAALPNTAFTTAKLPAANTLQGAIVLVSDGNAGSPCLAFSDGAAWHRLVLGAAPSATA